MKLVTFSEGTGARVRIGVVVGDNVLDLSVAAPALPSSMKGLIAAGPAAWEQARAVAAAGEAGAGLNLEAVRLLAPIPDPGKVLAIGLNYADHVAESGQPLPKHQIWFNKQWNATTGPGDVLIPAVAPAFVDYEAELCLIVGRRCRHVPRERAHEVVFGYTCGNDVSVRDWQLRTPQFTLGKSFATHGPIGPWIVTPDEFGDPHDKAIRCYVNGERRQHSNTRHLIFDCWDQIAELTAAFPLDPGDMIFTGTPDGVGGAMKPPRFLAPGDRVRVEIDGIGALENVMRPEEQRTVIE
jgi:2-keto-4-pentenoate hydratase/2-oxohepta-3-ene-1,7-dioic acid hydratase in catechol pathway